MADLSHGRCVSCLRVKESCKVIFFTLTYRKYLSAWNVETFWHYRFPCWIDLLAFQVGSVYQNGWKRDITRCHIVTLFTERFLWLATSTLVAAPSWPTVLLFHRVGYFSRRNFTITRILEMNGLLSYVFLLVFFFFSSRMWWGKSGIWKQGSEAKGHIARGNGHAPQVSRILKSAMMPWQTWILCSAGCLELFHPIFADILLLGIFSRDKLADEMKVEHTQHDIVDCNSTTYTDQLLN